MGYASGDMLGTVISNKMFFKNYSTNNNHILIHRKIKWMISGDPVKGLLMTLVVFRSMSFTFALTLQIFMTRKINIKQALPL